MVLGAFGCEPQYPRCGELAAQRRAGGDHPLLNSSHAYSRIRPLANGWPRV
jgi:hypothetical protein